MQASLQQTMGDPVPVAVEEYDYEGLPPNFTLVENMAAGAFAGIAVIRPPSLLERIPD